MEEYPLALGLALPGAPPPPVSYPRPATIIAFLCAVIFIVVGVIGNLITFVALVACPKLRGHATTTFILSLCVSDLLFCSLNLPLTASRYLHQRWQFGHALCQLFPVILYGNVAVSLLSMVAITINRYILIAYYDMYATIYSTRSICIQLILIWGIAFGLMTETMERCTYTSKPLTLSCTLLSIRGFALQYARDNPCVILDGVFGFIPPLLGVWGQLGLDPATFSCTILKKDGHSPKKFLFFVGIAIPCFVIIISYSCIYWKVRQSKLKLEAHSQLSVKESSNSAREREDTRLTTLMLGIFICFIICFLPLLIMNVADDDIRYPILHVIASIMAWASCVINPLIYAATNRQYRSAYKKLFNIFQKKPAIRRTTMGSRTCCQPSTNNSNSHYEKKIPVKIIMET